LNVWAVLAPAIMLGMLTICVNLLADAYVQTAGRSTLTARRSRFLSSLSPTPSFSEEELLGEPPPPAGD
jgi:hypothetical protein